MGNLTFAKELTQTKLRRNQSSEMGTMAEGNALARWVSQFEWLEAKNDLASTRHTIREGEVGAVLKEQLTKDKLNLVEKFALTNFDFDLLGYLIQL